MAGLFVVTPWRDGNELLELRRDLFNTANGENEDRRESAVSKVFAWRVRKQELPLLLDSTADIVDAILQDEKGVLTHNALRLLYSTAISRFITSISDTQIDLSRNRPSWFPPGKTLQFPIYLLEVRHRIVHRHLPLLAELKRAAKESLNWLWEWYWSHLDIAFASNAAQEEVGTDKEVKERLQAMLKTYVRERRGEIKAKRKECKAAEKAVESYRFIDAPRITTQRMLVELLVDEKAILPTNKKMGESMLGAFLIWTPFILAICTLTLSFLRTLMDQMIALLSSSSAKEPVREGMYQWLLNIFSSDEWKQARYCCIGESGSGAERKFFDHVLELCFTSPTWWNLNLAGGILEEDELKGSELWRNEWLAVLKAAKSGEEEQTPLPGAVEDEMDLDAVERALLVSPGKTIELKTKVCGPVKKIGLWKPQPIGVIPNGWEYDE